MKKAGLVVGAVAIGLCGLQTVRAQQAPPQTVTWHLSYQMVADTPGEGIWLLRCVSGSGSTTVFKSLESAQAKRWTDNLQKGTVVAWEGWGLPRLGKTQVTPDDKVIPFERYCKSRGVVFAPLPVL